MKQKRSRAVFTRLAHFLFETGTLRRVPRIHQQTLLAFDPTDSIASHSYRVSLIGWILAEIEGADSYKVVTMCLLHDIAEIRTNDHNWVHKRYVKVFEDAVVREQLDDLPLETFSRIASEYGARKSKEARLAKDADHLDQLLLLREYEWQGNKEAREWLYGGKDSIAERLKRLTFKSSKSLAREIFKLGPTDWWKNLWTQVNR